MVSVSYLIKDVTTGENVRKTDYCKEGTNVSKIKEQLKQSGATAIKITFEEDYKGRHINARC